MALQFYDSLRKTVVPFEPLDPSRVTVYGCGPTIYNAAHIGNFRTFLVYDLLHRFLRWRGFNVDFVVNFTDVDDKTIRGAAEAGLSIMAHTAPFGDQFLLDAEALGFLPFKDHPKATGFIVPMIELVEQLIAKGNAYLADDGSVYFDVQSFGDYGRLSGNRADGAASRSRIDADEYDKEDVRDFVLWKATRDVDGEVGAVWDSPWGPGRPGWHLECSAMATRLLGDTIDFHLGGEDLLFPHHDNEIAQSECATGHPFVRHWLHVKHLRVADQKMSKSLGNFVTVRELIEEGHDPASVRWALLAAHYRHELNFSRDSLAEASASIQRLLDFRNRVQRHVGSDLPRGDLSDRAKVRLGEFGTALDNDLNVPEALAAIWGLVKDGNTTLDQAPAGISQADREAVLDCLAQMDSVFGVLEAASAARSVDEGFEALIQGLIDDRKKARDDRNFAAADKIRDDLLSQGVVLEDGPEGTTWKRIHQVGS